MRHVFTKTLPSKQEPTLSPRLFSGLSCITDNGGLQYGNISHRIHQATCGFCILMISPLWDAVWLHAIVENRFHNYVSRLFAMCNKTVCFLMSPTPVQLHSRKRSRDLC